MFCIYKGNKIKSYKEMSSAKNMSNTIKIENSNINSEYSQTIDGVENSLLLKNLEPSPSYTNKKKVRDDSANLCLICNKVFTTKGNLKAHQAIHNGLKPYKCEISWCNKRYINECRLKVHQRTHNGEKPFECELCKKSFNENGNLKTHMRIHTGERPFPCDFDSCNASFKTSGQLSDHKRIHLNIRPFECQQCKKTYARSCTLKMHMKIHLGIRPFHCEYKECTKTFSEKGNMKNHLKKHYNRQLEFLSNNLISNENTNNLISNENTNMKSLINSNNTLNSGTILPINVTETKFQSPTCKVEVDMKNLNSKNSNWGDFSIGIEEYPLDYKVNNYNDHLSDDIFTENEFNKIFIQFDNYNYNLDTNHFNTFINDLISKNDLNDILYHNDCM